MKYFIILNDKNRVNGVFSEEYLPKDVSLIEVTEETARLPSTTKFLDDWLYDSVSNTLQYNPVSIEASNLSATFFQEGF